MSHVHNSKTLTPAEEDKLVVVMVYFSCINTGMISMLHKTLHTSQLHDGNGRYQGPVCKTDYTKEMFAKRVIRRAGMQFTVIALILLMIG